VVRLAGWLQRRNCAQQGQLLQREDKRELERRVTEFLTWMMRRVRGPGGGGQEGAG
jgi:hypothetical protein